MVDTKSPALHHVEIIVKDEDPLLKLFVVNFGFEVTHFRANCFVSQWVLRSGKSIFVITKLTKATPLSDSGHKCFESIQGKKINDRNSINYTFNSDCLNKNSKSVGDNADIQTYPYLFPNGFTTEQPIDSVFNVALEVKNVHSITSKIRYDGGTIIHEPFTINDEYGVIKMSVVASKCENVVHTLIEKSQYKDSGGFLPGFKFIKPFCKNELDLKLNDITNDLKQRLTSHIDHVTLVCRVGESQDIINWYENCFNMKRFFISPDEQVEDGFVLGEGIGLRLKTLQYWLCAESGIEATEGDGTQANLLRIVVAEPLPEIENSHVATFLRENLGPGTQHIGLHCEDIVSVVQLLKDRGVVFRIPPPAYYDQCTKLDEVVKDGIAKDVDEIRRSGILIDCEEVKEGQRRYLMQIFTYSIFSRDTFFLEVIQRCGATGFGAGNVIALAKSIGLYENKENHAKINID